jgi:hypothetical protein
MVVSFQNFILALRKRGYDDVNKIMVNRLTLNNLYKKLVDDLSLKDEAMMDFTFAGMDAYMYLNLHMMLDKLEKKDNYKFVGRFKSKSQSVRSMVDKERERLSKRLSEYDYRVLMGRNMAKIMSKLQFLKKEENKPFVIPKITETISEQSFEVEETEVENVSEDRKERPYIDSVKYKIEIPIKVTVTEEVLSATEQKPKKAFEILPMLTEEEIYKRIISNMKRKKKGNHSRILTSRCYIRIKSSKLIVKPWIFDWSKHTQMIYLLIEGKAVIDMVSMQLIMFSLMF